MLFIGMFVEQSLRRSAPSLAGGNGFGETKDERGLFMILKIRTVIYDNKQDNSMQDSDVAIHKVRRKRLINSKKMIIAKTILSKTFLSSLLSDLSSLKKRLLPSFDSSAKNVIAENLYS